MTPDLFGQTAQPATVPTLPADMPLARGARVELLSGSYAGLVGRVVSLWVRQDGQSMVDVALDAGYVVSVRVGSVGRL